jgi:probable O-glycosylation ligase (exosortase A-associated)
MMNPHKMTWGFAYSLPFALVVAIVTLLTLPFTRRKHPIPWCAPLVLIVLYWVWTCVTSVFALSPPQYVYDAWVKLTKIQVMLFVTIMLIQDREKLDRLIWVIVASIGFFGMKGGLWTLLTGGGHRVYGPPGGFIEGNNEIGLALVMTVPLMYYLSLTAQQSKSLPIFPQWQKYGLWAGMALSGVAALGTHSRGAFLAIMAMAFLLGWKSRHKIFTSAVLALGLVLAISFMPENWTSRMETITSHADTSAQGRLQAWAMIWNLALDRPLVGAGFDFISIDIWSKYAAGPIRAAYGAHSVYFQVLGEHGFVGLGLYLLIGFTTWRLAGSLASQCRKKADLQWVVLLMRMVQVSMMGFAVGGAFLGLGNWDLPFYLAGIVAMANVIAKRELASAEARQGQPVVPARGREARALTSPGSAH